MSKASFQLSAATRLTDRAALALLALAVATLAAGVLIPIYSDEIAMQMVRARFFIEGGALLNLLPQCRPLATSVPVSWYPGAVFNALLYSGAGNLGLRIRGIAICAAWLSLFWVWAGRHPQTLLSRRSFQGLVLSLNMLGVLPFVLVLARSEQLLVLALTGFCMVPVFWRATQADGAHVKGLKAALLFLMASIFLMAHPKALFFAPVMLASTWLSFRAAGKGWVAGTVLSVVFAIWQSFEFVQASSRCTDASAMSQVLGQHTLNFQLLATDGMAFLKAAWVNLSSAPGLVLDRVPATAVYQSNWLPSLEGPWAEPSLAGFGHLLKASLYALALLLQGTAVVLAAMQLWRKRLQAEALLGAALVAGLVLHGVVYNVNAWHFYTPGFVVPALVVLLLLVWPTRIALAGWMRPVASAFAFYWMLLAFASMALLLAIQPPRLLRIAQAGDYVIAGQPLSTPVFVREERRAQLSALARQCGIEDGDERLVLDGPAYFRFQHGRQPINVFYVSEYAFGMDLGPKIPAFLRKIDSGGVVSRCEYLPKALQGRAVVQDGMCCVPKSAW